MRLSFTAAVVAVGLCLIVAGVALAVESNVYWRTDLHQGSSIIAYGQGTSEETALQDCYRLQATTRAMTAAETRKAAVAAVTTQAVRWCNNPRRYSTVTPDPVVPAGTATLSWKHATPPAIVGFRIVHGADPAALVGSIQIPNAAARSYTVTNLPPGNRCFAVIAYDSTDVESDLSNIVCKVVT